MMTISTMGTRLGAVLTLATVLGSVALAQTSPSKAPKVKADPSGPILPAFAPQQVISGRDRFLAEPVLTTDALVEALKTNKVFRQNIAKHFNLPEDRVVSFVQDALVPYVLPQDTAVTNYGVTKAGLIYGKKSTLKKGTRVWATRSGDPILKWICSNPLTPKVPILKKPPTPSKVSSISRPVGLKQVAANEIAPAGLEGLPGGQVAFENPSEPPVVPPVVKVPLKGTGTNTVKPTPTPRYVPSIARTGLPLLPLAGIVGIVVRSVPQPKGTVDPKTLQQQQPSNRPGRPNTVPEPGTLLLAGLGLASLPLLRRRK